VTWPLTGRGPLVLCYHATSASWEHLLSVPPENLLRQLRALVRWYRPIAAGEVLSADPRALHVTFDDAYRSVATVIPSLRTLGVPVTVFVCSNYAAGGMPLDVPELALEAATRPSELATMEWDELRALAEDGVEIASHTASHAHLTRLGDTELRFELTESRDRIENELQRECRFLAYPYGEEDKRVRTAARKAGYTAAFALQGGSSQADPFAIPRLGIWRQDYLLRIVAKLAFAR